MNYEYYLEKFQKSADRLDKKMLTKKHMEIHVGITLESVVLKLYKRSWTNDKMNPLNARTRIFFAIWTNDKTLRQNKIFYNIHALKLRDFKGYSITSKGFANSFREDFLIFEQDWKNVSTKYGPLTLMEGWEHFENATLEDIVLKLANKFLSIEHLIDNTLEKYQSTNINS